MWISDLAIRRPIVTVVAMLVLVLTGLLALSRLQTDEFPDVALPVVAVVVPWPGASPEQIERDLLRPLEQKLLGLGGLKRLNGYAQDGAAAIYAEFVFAKAPSDAVQEVRDAVGAVRGELPSDIREPVIERFSDTDLPVQTIIVASSTASRRALGEQARRLANDLRTVPGVAQVRILGAYQPELAVRVRPDALQAADLSLAEVVATLERQNITAPAGRLASPEGERTLRFAGRPAGVAAFGDLVVARGSDGLVRLSDVATVEEAEAERRSSARYDGADAVSLEIRKTRAASTTDVADQLRARVAAAARAAPEGTTISIVQDAGVRSARAVRDVQATLIEGALLTVLVVYLFLNSWRSTVITGLALPISVLASFTVVWLFGFKLETMSLLGLSLAIGLLIDDAIVVRENIVRHVHMGKSHTAAAQEATREIGLAVLATTLAIVVVFLPVGFMDGVAGQWFKPFALTIASAVLVSLFVSFSLDPMLSAYWPDPIVPPETRGPLTRQLDRFNAWFDAQAERYRHLIGWALAHRTATLGAALLTLVVAAALPAAGVVGAEFLPVDDQSELRVEIETPPGTTLAETERRTEAFTAVITRHPEVRHTYATVGSSGEVTRASVLVQLVPRAERSRSTRALVGALRAEARRVAGASFSFLESGGVASGVKPIQLQVQGRDAARLAAVAERISARVRRIPGAVDVSLGQRAGQPQLDVVPNRTLAASLGISAADIGQALNAAFAGIETGDWVDRDAATRKVVVRLDAAARRTLADLERLPLRAATAAGGTALIPLVQVADIVPARSPARIEHKNGEAAVTIEANVWGRPLGDVAADIDRALAEEPLPDGVRLVQGGDVESQREVFGNMLLALAVALVAMYLILVLQFDSWLEPLAILVSLPLSLVGVVGALALTGGTINLMSLIGVVLLAGVVAKNAILLLEFAKQLHETHGMPLQAALQQAGAVRLRPIIMTTLALVAGMVPVAIGAGEGGQFRAPLGVAVIGGTLTSTLLTLLVVPTVYDLLMRLRRPGAAQIDTAER